MALSSFKKQLLLVLFIPISFFVISLLTLSDYGISWDEPIHFHRGQAYLNYILTGEVKFEKEKISSYYQSNELPAEYFLEKDDGHPPLNGIMASISNLLFYQKLGLLGDVEAYHLFNILVSTLLVLVVVLFAWETYGVFVSIVAGLIVATYPLFFAESHFNIKDPVQASFFSLTIWAFWKSLSKSKSWILVSAIGFACSLGTKFNILFLPLILIPHLIAKYSTLFKLDWKNVLKTFFQVIKSYFLVALVSFLIITILVFGTWPFLWQDPVGNFIFIIKWYKDIGTGQATYGYFTQGGFNLFAPIWIFLTTPPLVLLFTAIGMIASLKRRKEKNWAPFLWMLWFVIPITRVVIPNTTIYGGVRQIMEFLPAMALLAGLGSYEAVNWAYAFVGKALQFKGLSIKLFQVLLLLLFIPQILVLIRLHPNQNVYFNSFIGGLSGAKFQEIPYWGNSLGNAYLQAVNWINSNAKPGEKVALVQGTSVNIPRIILREDIAYSNSYWTGVYRGGEYLIELTHNDLRFYPYAWEYIERFLEPVYEVKVDGVAIAKVWKNDLDHTKEEFKGNEIIITNAFVKTQNGREVILDLGHEVTLTRLVIYYQERNCDKISARVSTSLDNNNWHYEPEEIPADQVFYREEEETTFEPFFFPGRRARFISLEDYSSNSCILSNSMKFKVFVLDSN